MCFDGSVSRVSVCVCLCVRLCKVLVVCAFARLCGLRLRVFVELFVVHILIFVAVLSFSIS